MLISSLKVFTNDRFKCVVVRVKCDQNFPSQLFVLLTVDEFVGGGGGPLARQKQDATFMVKLAHCLLFFGKIRVVTT